MTKPERSAWFVDGALVGLLVLSSVGFYLFVGLAAVWWLIGGFTW